jgi:phosphatidylglycerophosphatase A
MYALRSNLEISYSWMITFILIGIAFMVVHHALPLFRGDRDPAQIVIDEFVGFALVASCIPCSPISFAAAFFLFRFFDILKPLGIRVVEERYEGEAGIVFDDLLAAFYAAICVWGLLYIL